MSRMSTLGVPHKRAASKSVINWLKDDSVFTADNLIDAYIQGKEKGRNEAFNILRQQLISNIDLAKTTAEKVFDKAISKKIDARSVRIKANGLSQFTALFIVGKDDFISDSFKEVYTLARKEKNNVTSENFYINFSFMPDTGNINEQALAADGYFLKYGQ